MIVRIQRLDIFCGRDRYGTAEAVSRITMRPGETLAIVGPTGSGKTEFLADIEQLALGDTPSGRRIFIDERECMFGTSGMVATLSQRTNFVVDTDVESFVSLHAASLGKKQISWCSHVLNLANTLCGEPMRAGDPLQRLSGGQTRALMIADIALIADAPIVLIDEVENAGIDKHTALAALAGHGKIIISATHDPVLMLMHQKRLVMKGGGMHQLVVKSDIDDRWLVRLAGFDTILLETRDRLRKGEDLRFGEAR